jgi:hypothetical protein
MPFLNVITYIDIMMQKSDFFLNKLFQITLKFTSVSAETLKHEGVRGLYKGINYIPTLFLLKLLEHLYIIFRRGLV